MSHSKKNSPDGGKPLVRGKTEWLARKGARSALAMFEMFSVVKLLEMNK